MKSEYKIILFYKFINIKNPEKLKDEQRILCESLNLKGRILIAEEGINATLEGKTRAIASYKTQMHRDKLFGDIVFKESTGTGSAFSRLEVKVRPEVVTLGVGKLNIKKNTAKTISADELQKMYEKNEDFVILDLRNEFELKAGYFDKSVDPKLANFRDLPGKLPELTHLKNKKVVAVCTGGIRCEKATPLLQKGGFTNLYQLKDGIHTYMAKYPEKHFKGSLFVFDNRMTTSVVDAPNREVVGKCEFCNSKSEDFYSDDSVRPSKKLIACKNCIQTHSELRSCVELSLTV